MIINIAIFLGSYNISQPAIVTPVDNIYLVQIIFKWNKNNEKTNKY